MTRREFQDRLRKRARRAGVVVPSSLADRLEGYIRLLARWNEKINLTGFHVGEPDDEAIDRLLVEPLVGAAHLDPSTPTQLMDLGSGSGSPAIPLALATGFPVLMVESKVRKAAFLSEAVRQLGLGGSAVETSRYERLLTRPELHEHADVLTIRAVRVDARALLTVQAFVRANGRVFWFRGSVGPETPTVPPPLRWEGNHALPAGENGGRLVILRKEFFPG